MRTHLTLAHDITASFVVSLSLSRVHFSDFFVTFSFPLRLMGDAFEHARRENNEKIQFYEVFRILRSSKSSLGLKVIPLLGACVNALIFTLLFFSPLFCSSFPLFSSLQIHCLSLINTLINKTDEIIARNKMRNDFLKVGLGKVMRVSVRVCVCMCVLSRLLTRSSLSLRSCVRALGTPRCWSKWKSSSPR